MSGHTRGAQARTCICAQYPTARYVHCKSHSINLATVHDCNQCIVSNMFTVLCEMLYFLNLSPKCLQVHLDYTEANGPRLQRLCETRWSQHAERVTLCINNLSAILAALAQLYSESDQNTRANAFSLLRTVTSFEFIVTMPSPFDTTQ